MAETKYQQLLRSLENDYKSLNINLKNQDLASAIQKASDFYIDKPREKSPWDKEYFSLAYQIYYHPLNTIRYFKLISMIEANLQKLKIKRIIDIGSGLGAFSKALSFYNKEIEIVNIEISEIACKLHKKQITSGKHKWQNHIPDLKEEDLLVFSYSLTEDIKIDSYLPNAKHILIVEPATKEDFQHLLKARTSLMQNNFYLHSPCTHQQNCPMANSKKDWCHFPVNLDLPNFLKQLIQQTKFSHQYLAFSYLLVSKKMAESSDLARVVGYPLTEKGKMRQMICRSDKREFLSMLKKEGGLPIIKKGDVIKITKSDKKGNEIRIANPSSIKIV